MAIAFVSAGTASNSAGTLSPAYPATVTAGNLLVIICSNKYPTNGPATPSGWIAPSNNQGEGGAGSAGVDSGTMYCTVFVRVADGSESGSVTLTMASSNAGVARILQYSKTTGTWGYALVNGADNSAGTSWSVTGGSDPGIAGGDFMVVGSAINGNVASFTSQALSATGVTFGTMTERNDAGFTTGDDCAWVITEHEVTSGTSSAAPVYTMTGNTTSGNCPAGATVVVRLREVDTTITCTGIATAETFGTARIDGEIACTAIGSELRVGTPAVGSADTITCTAIGSAEAFGTATLSGEIAASAIASTEAFGTALIQMFEITCTGISSTELFGAATVSAEAGGPTGPVNTNLNIGLRTGLRAGLNNTPE